MAEDLEALDERVRDLVEHQAQIESYGATLDDQGGLESGITEGSTAQAAARALAERRDAEALVAANALCEILPVGAKVRVNGHTYEAGPSSRLHVLRSDGVDITGPPPKVPRSLLADFSRDYADILDAFVDEVAGMVDENVGRAATEVSTLLRRAGLLPAGWKPAAATVPETWDNDVEFGRQGEKPTLLERYPQGSRARQLLDSIWATTETLQRNDKLLNDVTNRLAHALCASATPGTVFADGRLGARVVEVERQRELRLSDRSWHGRAAAMVKGRRPEVTVYRMRGDGAIMPALDEYSRPSISRPLRLALAEKALSVTAALTGTSELAQPERPAQDLARLSAVTDREI